jgi:hypothetical protein
LSPSNYLHERLANIGSAGTPRQHYKANSPRACLPDVPKIVETCSRSLCSKGEIGPLPQLHNFGGSRTFSPHLPSPSPSKPGKFWSSL